MTEPAKTTKTTKTGEEAPETFLQKKYAGIPLWIFVVGVGLVIFLVIFLRRQNAASSSSTTDTTGEETTESAALVPPFINQVYVAPTPPVTTAPPVSTARKTKVISTSGAHDFRTIAKNWKMSGADLAKLNPALAAKYLNTGKNIPTKTKVTVWA